MSAYDRKKAKKSKTFKRFKRYVLRGKKYSKEDQLRYFSRKLKGPSKYTPGSSVDMSSICIVKNEPMLSLSLKLR